MRLVKFNREMAPHGVGDTRALPDDVADRLVEEGAASIEPSVFDAAAAAGQPMKSRCRRIEQTRSLI